MRRDVDGDALTVDAVCLKLCPQAVERGLRAGGDGQLWRVHGGEVKVIAQPGLERVSGQGDREHAAFGHRVKERAAQMHQPNAILEGHHTGEAGGGVFAHGMADQRFGRHAPGHPELRQRIFHDHDQGELHRGLFQTRVSLGAVRVFGQPERANVVIQLGLQDLQTPVDPVGENRLCFVEIARHPGILRAAAGEHEDHLGFGIERGLGKDAAGVHGVKQVCGLIVAAGHQHAAMFKLAASLLQGPGHIGEALLGMGAQMGGEALGIGLHRRLAAAGDGEDLEGPVAVFGRAARGRFFQHHMGVGAADAQRVHTGAAGAVAGLPRGEAVIYHEGRVVEINRGIGGLIAQRGRHFAMFQGE